MRTQKKRIVFRNETEEFKFWSKANSLDYIDRSTFSRARFPSLKPTTRPIPIRLPVSLIERIKVLSHKQGVPYHSLLRIWIEEGLRKATG